MTLIIERLNGKTYNLEQLGIRVVEFEPESPNIQNEIVSVDGGGVIVQERGYGSRYITANFRIHNRNLTDYAVFRSELFELFGTNETFYIIDTKEPFKRWVVRTDGNYSLNRAIKTGDFSINFICIRIFAESVMTSSELQIMQNDGNIKEWDRGIWSWNSGITWDSTYNYSFNSNSFSVSNIGNTRIDPAYWPLEIIIKATTSSYLQINNNTTGDSYRYNGVLTDSDTLVISGVRTLKNGISVFGDTNFKLISLNPGENDFSITGGTIKSITFNFRQPYK